MGSFTAPEDREARVPPLWRSQNSKWSASPAFELLLTLIERTDIESAALFGWGHDTAPGTANAALADEARTWLSMAGSEGNASHRIVIAQSGFGDLLTVADIPEGCAIVLAPHRRTRFETNEEFAQAIHHLLDRVHRPIPKLTVFVAQPQRRTCEAALHAAGLRFHVATVERSSWWQPRDPQLQVRSRWMYHLAQFAPLVARRTAKNVASRLNLRLSERPMEVLVAPETSLARPGPRLFYSCFLSYSHADIAFAQRLRDDLTDAGVDVWFDKTGLRVGNHLDQAVNGAIRRSDRFLLLCSSSSLNQESCPWVSKELKEALNLEQERPQGQVENRSLVLPLDLDGHLFSDECKHAMAQTLRDRLAVRFAGPENYQHELNRILTALRKPPIQESIDLTEQLFRDRQSRSN